MSTHRTYYNYRGRKPEYDLTIDPSKELEMWFNYCAEKRFFDES